MRYHTKPHPGLGWRIFHILTSEDIHDFKDIMFDAYSWDIELNNRRDIPYLRAPMYYPLFHTLLSVCTLRTSLWWRLMYLFVFDVSHIFLHIFTFYGYVAPTKWPAPCLLDSSIDRGLYRIAGVVGQAIDLIVSWCDSENKRYDISSLS